ncbi:hypothetical protein EYF80_062199 [Liparis tanakae]|uniref:Uncharacterized protein n=1 Tax=Liparis tanakae TaxID=230148 RepID=A0A4Z2EFZ9_9TELE|nr:hypothetical protein EYF80_062199 [Liparis tanakae]
MDSHSPDGSLPVGCSMPRGQPRGPHREQNKAAGLGFPPRPSGDRNNAPAI